MGYLDNLLGRNERIVFRTRQHWLVLVWTAFLDAVLALLVIVAAVVLFQVQDIPEKVLSRNDFAFLKNMVKLSFVKACLTNEDLRYYEKAWSQSGAMTAMINYYRANMTPSILFADRAIVFPKIQTSTLIIWGEKDTALSRKLVENSEEFVDAQCSIEFVPDCGHWVQLEQPNFVNDRIKKFLKI